MKNPTNQRAIGNIALLTNFAPLMMEEFNRLSKLEKDEYYITPEGYVVFTEKYLLKRGYCCQNGCRHCPYGFNPKTQKFDKKKT
jgi:hypothetical protein